MKHLKFLLGGLLCLFLLTLTSVVHANPKESVTKETVLKANLDSVSAITVDVLQNATMLVDKSAPKSTGANLDHGVLSIRVITLGKSNEGGGFGPSWLISNTNHNLKNLAFTSSGGSLSYRLLSQSAVS